MKYALIQVLKPFKGEENALVDCFHVIGKTTSLEAAIVRRDTSPNPNWFIIIQVW